MILTEEQLNSLSQAALPLMIWLSENCHPHCTAIVDSGRTELLEGLATAIYKPEAKQPESQPESTEAQPESQPYSEPHPEL
jgi:hypothetical protein